MNLGESGPGPVECLGMTFESDEARREHFTKLLREKLDDESACRAGGFPSASVDDILAMSDPPYFTACPNPWLADFVSEHGTPYDPTEEYHREPFAVDVSEGKFDQLYKAHGYHTKVPHLAIVPSILHYSEPGDLILDGFAGSGMTGLAAQWCARPSVEHKREIEARFEADGLAPPIWGARRAILNDLSPAAAFIAAGMNVAFPVEAFVRSAQTILDELATDVGWMYETAHSDGRTGRIRYTVWSQVFGCPDCAGDIVFVDVALDPDTKKTLRQFPCPHCGSELRKAALEPVHETIVDAATGEPHRIIKQKPVLIEYELGDDVFEKRPDPTDLALISRTDALPLPASFPTEPFPLDTMYHGSRLAPRGVTNIHHLFRRRAALALGRLWDLSQRAPTARREVLFFAEQAIWGMSMLARYTPTHYSQVNQYLNGVYYIGSQVVEVTPWYILDNKLARLAKSFQKMPRTRSSIIQVGDCASLDLPNGCVDYVFTDPPFGENIPYSDLNIVVESFHRVLTNTDSEAIVDKPKGKQLHEYQELMRRCFAEYFRVLKPGRWMTVVFSNSANSVWHAIQEALSSVGFVVADVRTLDKKQGSYRQVTSTAVKQDLVISVYRPSDALEQTFSSGHVDRDSVWTFVREHLDHVPVFLGSGGAVDVVRERTTQVLFDRMIGFYVQRGLPVPVGVGEFQLGLRERFSERDGMFFLSEQVAEYDRKRMKASELRQLTLFVSDESSAIQWVRQHLQDKPQTFQALQPQFMQQLQQWEKHEEQVELRDILEQNFLRFSGDGPVPSQIHSYLSTNYPTLRSKGKDDAELRAKATGRWFVPDPAKEDDLQKLRARSLLKLFNDYRATSAKRLKEFRTEAIRAGFKDAYERDDYGLIVAVADKLPESVLQEDHKLLMYYDVAQMRISG